MIKLPINLDLTLTDGQIGALACKQDVLTLIKNFNDVDCCDSEGNIIPEKLLEVRSKLISETVNKLGDLNEFQKGYISALLEKVEMSHDGCEANLKKWLPCLITGVWQ